MNPLPQLGYEFKNPDWLNQAITHKSYANEKRLPENNEKLEFIGDAVIDLVIAEALFQAFPSDDEGNLSKKRASLVNEASLSEIALGLGLQGQVLVGRGEAQTGGETRPRLLASAFEAVIGAMFMDGGFNETREKILNIFSARLRNDSLLKNYENDFKSRFQEIIQKKFKVAPNYKVVEETGAPHDRLFVVEVTVKDQKLAEGRGRSKKEAEQKAAEAALGLKEFYE